MRNARILIVSYLFPPAGGITVQRALSLAKYLPRCGFEVHVLTAGNAAAPVRDPALLQSVPSAVTIHRAFSPEIPFALRQSMWGWLTRARRSKAPQAAGNTKPGGGWRSFAQRLVRRILCPEPEVLWFPFALRKARQVVKRHGIDILMVTAPPFSTFLVGNALKREFPKLKYVSDFRDEWLSFYLKDFDFQGGIHTRARAGQIERETIERSDVVVAVAESSLHTIRERYPEQPGQKFACIPNGYDPDAFAGFQARPSGSRTMVVTHVGTVYKTATPRFFLDAVDAMPEDFRSRLEIRFIGRIAEGERRALESRKCNVRVLGFMPQHEALRHIEETDYLLLTMTNDISLPGKLYEYLATGKPILAMSPEHGEVERLLDRTGSGWCVNPYDSEAIQGMVRRAWARKEDGPAADPLQVDWQEVRRYARPRLAEEYGELMRARLGIAAGNQGQPAHAIVRTGTIACAAPSRSGDLAQ